MGKKKAGAGIIGWRVQTMSLKIAFSIFVPLCLSACGPLYFHSDSDQKMIDEAQKGFAAAKTAHLEALDTRSGLVATEIKRQREAVVAEQLALRDNQIGIFLDELKDNKDNELNADIKKRLNEILGSNRAEDFLNGRLPVKNADQNILINLKLSVNVRKNAVLSEADRLGINIPQKDVDQYCVRGPVNDALTERCEKFEAVLSQLESQKGCLSSDFGKDGFLSQVCSELGVIDEMEVAQQQIEKATKAKLDLSKDYYLCQVKLGTAANLTDNLRDTAKIINDFSDSSSGASALKTDTNPRESGKPQTCKIPPSWTEVLKDNGLDPRQFNVLVKKAEGFNPLKVAAAKITETEAAWAQSTLGKSILAVTKSDANSQATTYTNQSQEEKAAVEIVRLLEFIEDYQKAETGQLPDVPAALIGLARAQLALDLTSTTLERLRREKELLTFQRDALLKELDLLARADNKMKTNNYRAILLRGDAWSNGQLPFVVAQWDRKNLRYEDWATQERAIAKANYEILEPMVALLQEYGAGGISGKDLANWLAALAAVAIAYGVN